MRDPKLIQRAKQMRAEPTRAELVLWSALRARRFRDAKFRRQVVIRRYIADFACRIPCLLVVEIDGDTHDFTAAFDERRTADLTAAGYVVLRFTNLDVLENLEGVLCCIAQALPPAPLPVSVRSTTLSPEGETEQKGL
jgi:very-short-patch-repair endonuclease